MRVDTLTETPREIRALTSLRGLFALWVLGYHLTGSQFDPPYRPNLITHGYLGVDFFFLLSGFVLARSYGHLFATRWYVMDYTDFVGRRAARLFPLHAAVTLVCCAYSYGLGRPYSPMQVGEELMLVHRWPGVFAMFNAINGPAWSISTEWAANLLFPLFTGVTLASPRALALGFGLVAFLVLSWIVWTHGGTLDLTLANSIAPAVRCFCEFGVGMLICRYAPTFRKVGSDWAIALLAAAAILAISIDADILLVAIMVPAIGIVAASTGMAAQLLGNRLLHWLGEISYSVYLTQMPIVLGVHWLTNKLGAGQILIFYLGSITAVLAVSHVTYHFIERPARHQLSAMMVR